MRILGIDPGLRRLGWGVVALKGADIQHIANGVCQPAGGDLALRLASLFAAFNDVVACQKPDQVAIEQMFVNVNATATMKLAHARAVAILVPARAGLEVAEYAPNKVKKTVVGQGHATKAQVQATLAMLMPGLKATGPDAADALAVAWCHACHVQVSAAGMGPWATNGSQG